MKLSPGTIIQVGNRVSYFVLRSSKANHLASKIVSECIHAWTWKVRVKMKFSTKVFPKRVQIKRLFIICLIIFVMKPKIRDKNFLKISENFIHCLALDCPFPKDFDVDRITPSTSEMFKKVLNQRQQLHKNIEEGKVEEVSTILKEIEGDGGKLKHVFNQSNDSAMATALKHFNENTFALLVQKNLRFCEESVKLMWHLPESSREVIKDKNFESLTPINWESGKHKLLSSCLLTTGHLDREFYLIS